MTGRGPHIPSTLEGPVSPQRPRSPPLRALVATLRARRPPGVAAALAAGLALVALILSVQSVAVSFATHSPLPQEDEWANLAVFRSVMTGHTVWADMVRQHNEHRIPFPRLVLFADYLLARGRGDLDMVAIFIIQTFTCGLFALLLARIRGAAAGRVAVGAVVATLLFSLRQSENFIWGFQVQFVGVFAAGCLAVVSFAAAIARDRAGRPSATWAILAFGAATVAAFSMSNGLVVDLVLVALAVIGRAPRRFVATAVIVAGATVGAFAFGYEIFESGSLHAAVLKTPLTTLGYASAYLGNLFDPEMGLAVASGACGLAATAAIALWTAAGRDRDPTRLALLGIVMFTAGSALLTALGRSGSGLETAMASRYATGGACFWSALLVYGWSLSSALRNPAPLRAAVMAAGLVLVAAAVRTQAPTIGVLQDWAFKHNLVEDGILAGIVDDAALTAMDDDPSAVRALLPLLQERGLSIYASRDATLAGRPLAEAGHVEAAPCPGSFDVATRDPALGPAAVRVAGTALRRPWIPRSRRLYLADRDGIIRGFASTPLTPGRWAGYATVTAGGPLDAFLQLGSDRLCRIGAAPVSSATPPLSP